ncbi:DUF1156 domain-containing protein [Candidatus Hodarchaeum mangrovi]
MKSRLIEWNLPLREISKHSSSEKSIRHGHPSTLHLWWARRPLSASRATNFAALLELPNSPEIQANLLELVRKILPWDVVKNGHSPIISKAQKLLQKEWKEPPKILDPFSGGGSIPLESYRLGCHTYANELNPVAVLVQKASLEWPHLFEDNLLAEKVNYWANQVKDKVFHKIGKFYPLENDGWIPIGFIWARTIPCTNLKCQSEIPLIRHFWLAKKKTRKIAYKPIIHKLPKKVEFKIQYDDKIDFNPSKGTVNRGNATCLVCGETNSVKITRRLAREGKMGQRLLVLILRHPNIKGKRYRIAEQNDLQTWQEAKTFLSRKPKIWYWDLEPLPSEELPPAGSLGVNLQSYGYNQWKDLFNARQLLSLVSFVDAINSLKPEILTDCQLYPNSNILYQAILGYLALILGRLADKNANLVVYNVYGEKIEHVYGRTALPMKWDYAEVNVFSGGNGDWDAHKEWVVRFLKANSWSVSSSITITQGNAKQLPYPDAFFDAIITDPPYYDNVPYADLSDFFYVWFKRILKDIFPDLFSSYLSPKKEEIIANKSRQDNPKLFFESNLALAFKEMFRTLKPEGIAIIVYAHKSADGWEAMLQGLLNAGFIITASWPIQTEMKTRLRARYSAALGSSIYLVCRKIPKKGFIFLNKIENQIKSRISERLTTFWQHGVIGGGDYLISAIGPAMEIYSKYEKIFSKTKEPYAIKDLLNDIKEYSTQFLTDQLIKDDKNSPLDPYSKFYLMSLWFSQGKTLSIKEAISIAKSVGISLNELWCKGEFLKRDSKNIWLFLSQERRLISNYDTLINIMHRSLQFWAKEQESELVSFLTEMNILTNELFWRYCQTISEILPPREKEKQLLESLLVQQPRLQRLGK